MIGFKPNQQLYQNIKAKDIQLFQVLDSFATALTRLSDFADTEETSEFVQPLSVNSTGAIVLTPAFQIIPNMFFRLNAMGWWDIHVNTNVYIDVPDTPQVGIYIGSSAVNVLDGAFVANSMQMFHGAGAVQADSLMVHANWIVRSPTDSYIIQAVARKLVGAGNSTVGVPTLAWMTGVFIGDKKT